MAKGQKTGGRRKGTPNKNSTRILREAVIEAAELVGSDGLGKDGLVGYLQDLAANEKRAFTSLLGRVLPLQLTGEDGGPVAVSFTTVYEPRK